MHAVCIPAPDEACSGHTVVVQYFTSVNLGWHDTKLQHSSSDIVGIEEPFRLSQCGMPIHPSKHSHHLTRTHRACSL